MINRAEIFQRFPALVTGRPALMAEWSKALPLTAGCLSPLPGLESWLGHVRKLPVGLGNDFHCFLHHLQLDNHTSDKKVTKIEISNFNSGVFGNM